MSTEFEAHRAATLEARIAELPKDPAVLLKLLAQRHLLEISAWENCPEYVALCRAVEKAPITDNDRRWRFLEHGCQWVSWTPIGGETVSYAPRVVTTAQGVGLLAMRAKADETAQKHIDMLKAAIARGRHDSEASK